MRKNALLLTWMLTCWLLPAQAQKITAAIFERAYAAYPAVPRPLLEGLAQAASRLQPLVPDEEDDYHAGPPRYGLFALVQDGKGYFRNTLTEVCRHHGISEADCKKDPALEVMAVAHYLHDLCLRYNVKDLLQVMPVLEAFSELPATGNVNQFARASAAYEVYYQLSNGFAAGEVTVHQQTLEPQNWFDAQTFRLVKSPAILIDGDAVQAAGEAYRPRNNTAAATGPDAVTATDYPPALWLTSPNYSSRNSTAISAVTIHTTQGSYAGTLSWFQNTASNVSAHYTIRSSDGQITQMVREAQKAWHVGNENPYTVGIEHEGFVAQTGWYTTAMYNASAALTKDICTDNGINPTTCYNGPAHSGVVLLSSTIRIKGHQHFPNQNHSDPGINWDWPRYYGLINPSAACSAPATLNESFVSTAFANLNWTAVTGASSYTLEWKTSAAATWSSTTSTVNYKTIAGLAAGTSYNWRIKTTCSSGGVSAYSATKTFSTQASCWDANEPNNVYTAPSSYNTTNTFTYGKICGSGDVDFYRITTTATQNITFKLQTLPKNYNIETFTGAGAFLAGGYAAGTADETVTLFSRPAGSYLFKVYAANGADNDALNDYRLQVTLAAPTTPVRLANVITSEELVQEGSIGIYPNPVQQAMQVSWQLPEAGAATIEVLDYFNRRILVQRVQSPAGAQTLRLNSSQWKDGAYLLRITHSGGVVQQRFMVRK